MVVFTERNGIKELNILAYKNYLHVIRTVLEHMQIRIDGDALDPIFYAVRFENCTVIAENLLAFRDCYFSESCTMLVKSMPLNQKTSVNNNVVHSTKVLRDEK